MWIAIASFFIFILTDVFIQPKYTNVDIVPLFVSSVSGIFTHYDMYFNPYSFINIYNFELEKLPCYVWVIPELVYGYSVYEMIMYIRYKRIDYFLHGFAMFTMFSNMYYLNAIHSIFPALITETSSIFLSFRKGKYKKNRIVNYGFTLTFYVYKWMIVPTILFRSIIDSNNPYRHYTSVYGFLFIGLNIYWGILIFKMIKRRVNTIS